jgi:fucose 4-O-acetylase-like acetyltransferase
MSAHASNVREAGSPPPAASPAPKPRLLYIDNLRILLISMVVLLHLAITYGAVGDWSYNEAVPDNIASAVVLTLYTTIAQAFTLAFFMMISSYFNPPAYDRKGPRGFLVDKLKRLGIPLLFYFFVLNPLLVVVIRALEGLPPFPPGVPPLTFWLDMTSPGPMWFVEALLLFTLVYLVWRLATARRGAAAAPPPPAASEARAPGNGALALFALALGLVTFVVRLAWPVDRWLEPFHFQIAQFPQYVAYFVIGLIAFRRQWFAGVRVAQARPWLWVMVGLLVVWLPLLVAGGALENGVDAFLGGMTWQSLFYCVWEQLLCVALVVTPLVWFRERFNHQGKVAAAMGAATYAVYIFHPLIIVTLSYALSGIYMIGVVKWVLVAPLALALCFGIAHLIRQLPGVRDIL